MRLRPRALIGLLMSASLSAEEPRIWLESQPNLSSAVLGTPPIAFDDRVWTMQFSADGTELFTVTDMIDRTVWSSGKRRTVWRPDGNETMQSALFSPDGSRFARTNSGNQVHVHETSTGKVLHSFEGRTPRFTATAWSTDGGMLAVGVGHEVVIHDLESGQPPRRLAAGEADVALLAWSPEGRWLAVATETEDRRLGSVSLLPLDGGKPIPLPGNLRPVFSFSPDSQTLAVACEKILGPNQWLQILYLWDIPGAKEIMRESGSGYNALVHSPDGRFLATCGLNSLRILDARSGKEIARREADSINNHLWSAAFSPDGKILATGIENRVRFHDTHTWDEIHPDEVLRAPVSALAFSADGSHLATGGWNGDLVLWNWQTKTPVWKRLSPPGESEIKALSIDPASRWIGVVQAPQPREKRGIRLVAFDSGETSSFIGSASSADAAPLFHPGSGTANIATREHTLAEVNCENGRIIRSLPIPFLQKCESGRYGIIDSLSFDPKHPDLVRWTAQTQAAGRIHMRSGEVSHAFETRFVRRDSDPIPPRGHEFAAIGGRVWNLPTLYQPTRLENGDPLPSVRHPSDLLQFSARGRRVRVFDILSQAFIATYDFGPGDIHTIALSPDGLTLVVGSTGGLRYRSLEGPPVAEKTPLETLWNLMGGDEHWIAYQAAWALARQPDFIAFLESRLKPAHEPSAEMISLIKAQLADSSHEVRQTAARQWLDLGFELDDKTREVLPKGARQAKWPGVTPPGWSGDPTFSGMSREEAVPPLIPLSAHRQAMRAVILLKASTDDAARRLLEQLAKGHHSSPITRASRRSKISDDSR